MVRTRLPLPIIAALAFTCAAQALDVPDSLRAALRGAPDDTSYAQAAYTLARSLYAEGELDSARAYGAMGIERLGASGGRGPRHAYWLAQLRRIRGMGWYSASRYDSALVEFQRMQRHAEAGGVVKDLGAALSYQGFALRAMEDDAGALALLRRAVRVLNTLPPGPDIANIYNELGIMYAAAGAVDSAVVWYGLAVELYREQGNDHHRASTSVNMADALFTAGRWAEADSMQRAVRPLLTALNDPMARGRWATGEARILLREGRTAEAVPLLDSAIAGTVATGDLNTRHHLLLLRALAHARAGRMHAAYADQQASIAAHDEDLDLEKIRATEKARGSFEHEKAIALERAGAERQRMQKMAALVIGGMALLLALIGYRSLRAQRRAAEALRLKNEEIQRAQAGLVASEKRREAGEVRTRIARDIHDDIGATITKIRLLSDVAATNGPEEHAATRRALERIGEHVRVVGHTMSDIVWAVDPARDSCQGMLDHVRTLCARLLGDNGIVFTTALTCDRPAAPMEPGLRRDLHLVINEALNNILKYARASHVDVRMHLGAAEFQLGIADDGQGFTEGTVRGAGNGLRNMRDRIERHGGAIDITSAPGQGTRITAHGRT